MGDGVFISHLRVDLDLSFVCAGNALQDEIKKDLFEFHAIGTSTNRHVLGNIHLKVYVFLLEIMLCDVYDLLN